MKGTTVLTVGHLTIAVLVFFTGIGQLWAQQEHTHESRHGGEIRTMGEYHVEFLVVEGENDIGYIVVYLLDKNQKPVSVNEMEGVAYLTLPDKSKQTLKLVATPEMLKSDHHDEEEEHVKVGMHREGIEDVSHFQAKVNLRGVDTFNAVLSLKMGGMRNNLRFKYVRGIHGHEEGEVHDH